MPILVNGNEVEVVRINGVEQDEVRVNGRLVHQAEIPIDIYDRSDLGYHVGDEGQSVLPNIESGAGYDNPNALQLPSPDSPNDVTNLSDSNPAYDSSEQDYVLENYPRPGDVVELFIRPDSWSNNPQYRFSFFADGYYPSQHIRLRWTEGYWRIEQGSDVFGGTGDAEAFTGLDPGDWHRIVIDLSAFPTIEAHQWNAETGAYMSGLSGTDSSYDTSAAGIQMFWNDNTEVLVSDIRKIDQDDYNAGSDL